MRRRLPVGIANRAGRHEHGVAGRKARRSVRSSRGRQVPEIALIGNGGEKRFKREGKILGLLVHPNIAELIDAGVLPTRTALPCA